LVAQLRTEVFKEPGHLANVASRFPDRSGTGRTDRARPVRLLALNRGAVGGHPWDGRLNSDVPVALLHRRSGSLFDLARIPTAGVCIQCGTEPTFAPQELIDRHARSLALAVPEGHVYAAHGVKQNRAVAPVRADVGRLPDVLDLVDIAADQERLEVLVDRDLHRERALGECGTAQSIEARFRSHDLDDDQLDPVRRGHDRSDIGDLQRWELGGRWLLLLDPFLAAKPAPRKKARTAQSSPRRDQSQKFTLIHNRLLQAQAGEDLKCAAQAVGRFPSKVAGCLHEDSTRSRSDWAMNDEERRENNEAGSCHDSHALHADRAIDQPTPAPSLSEPWRAFHRRLSP